RRRAQLAQLSSEFAQFRAKFAADYAHGCGGLAPAMFVAGDFNCTREALLEDLGWKTRQDCSVATPLAPTRLGKCAPPPDALLGAETIDHVLVLSPAHYALRHAEAFQYDPSTCARAYFHTRASVVRVHETCVHTLSDHRPVEAIFERLAIAASGA